jgi:hypothetical protein
MQALAREWCEKRELARVLREHGLRPGPPGRRPRVWVGARLLGAEDLRVERARRELEQAEQELRDAVRARGQVTAATPEAARLAVKLAREERAARERFEAAQVALREAEQALAAAARGPQAKVWPLRGPSPEERREEQLEAWEAQDPLARLQTVDMRIETRAKQLAEVQRAQGRVRLASEYQELEVRRGALCRDLRELRELRERTMIEVEATREPDPAKRRAVLEARRAELIAERDRFEAEFRETSRRRNSIAGGDRGAHEFHRTLGRRLAEAQRRLEEIAAELRGVERRLAAD